jgi:hypothetical protein
MPLFKLRFTGFDAVPEHLTQLGVIAESLGISRSALLRLVIAQYIHREARKAKSQK